MIPLYVLCDVTLMYCVDAICGSLGFGIASDYADWLTEMALMPIFVLIDACVLGLRH